MKMGAMRNLCRYILQVSRHACMGYGDYDVVSRGGSFPHHHEFFRGCNEAQVVRDCVIVAGTFASDCNSTRMNMPETWPMSPYCSRLSEHLMIHTFIM